MGSHERRKNHQPSNCQVFEVQSNHAGGGVGVRVGAEAGSAQGGHLSPAPSRPPWSCTACFTNCPRTRGRWSASLFLLWYRTWKWQTAIRKKPVLSDAFLNTSSYTNEEKTKNHGICTRFYLAILWCKLFMTRYFAGSGGLDMKIFLNHNLNKHAIENRLPFSQSSDLSFSPYISSVVLAVVSWPE